MGIEANDLDTELTPSSLLDLSMLSHKDIIYGDRLKHDVAVSLTSNVTSSNVNLTARSMMIILHYFLFSNGGR